MRRIYVADVERLVHTRGFREPGLRDPQVQRAYCYGDTGLIAATVYRFAAATGSAAWLHNCDRARLTAAAAARGAARTVRAGGGLSAAAAPPMRLPGNTVLIAGGGSGLALAEKFLQHGSEVIICRSGGPLEAASAGRGGRSTWSPQSSPR